MLHRGFLNAACHFLDAARGFLDAAIVGLLEVMSTHESVSKLAFGDVGTSMQWTISDI